MNSKNTKIKMLTKILDTVFEGLPITISGFVIGVIIGTSIFFPMEMLMVAGAFFFIIIFAYIIGLNVL